MWRGPGAVATISGMDTTTIQRLNQINQVFYRTTATEFDQTRGRAWAGWLPVWEAIQVQGLAAAGQTLRVLDVGCGNGRLGVFLADQLAAQTPAVALHYHGMDSDAALLAYARSALTRLPPAAVTLDRRDIITDPPDTGQYDLVALFGVMHHVPGASNRRDLLRDLAARTAPGGLLAFACWRFYEYPRFRDRIVAWPDDLAGVVERHDYLLDWRRGERALRYCHYVDDAEQADLLAAAELPVLTTYRADGRSGDANQYAILRRSH